MNWAGSLLWSHFEKVRAYEGALGAEAFATLHHVRIEVKHLRYTLELFKAALGEEVESLHEQLVAVQDHLGDLYFQMKRYRDAQTAFDRALTGDRDGIDVPAVTKKRDRARELAGK